MRQGYVATILLMVILFAGCPGVKVVDVPANVFALQEEVIAVKAKGKPGEAKTDVKISLKRLRQKAPGGFDKVTLLEYGAEEYESIPYRWDGKDSIVANLTGGQTYLIFPQPVVRLADNYRVICKFDIKWEFVRLSKLSFNRDLCPLILCSADFKRADTLFTKFPKLEPFRDQLDFGDLEIGGWDPVGPTPCDKCTRWRGGHLYPIPEPACWLRPTPAVINMIPRSQSGETNQDSEPFLAVNPDNPQQMAGSAFTLDPDPSSDTAPIFVTEDKGETWRLSGIVPSARMTGDITHASTGGIATLYAGILRRPGNHTFDALRTPDFTSPTIMTRLATRNRADQPFLRAITIAGNDRVYIGVNDFNVLPNSATVDVSLDSGATWASVRIAFRGCSPQCGPSVRPAVAADGTVYAAYLGWQSFSGGMAKSDVVVVRDDNGAAGANPFRDLVGADGQVGTLAAQNVTIPWSNAPTLGQERIGSTLSLAVDPNNSRVVYIAWADRVGTGDIYTVHLRRSTDRGATWSSDLRTFTNATNPALAVADNGTVGLLYQQVTKTRTGSRWITHLEQTRDAFAHVQDTVLATVPANTPTPSFLPYLGDYDFLLAVGSQFRGVFSANNTPDLANFPSGVKFQRKADFTAHKLLDNAGNPVAVSIDPYYFRVSVMQ